MDPSLHLIFARSAAVLGLSLGGFLAPPALMAQDAPAKAGSLITVPTPARPAKPGSLVMVPTPAAQARPGGLITVPTPSAPADAASAERPVSYSPEQAERGKKRFISDCAECHGETLNGGLNGGPPLRGLDFDSKFAEGAPASSIFLFMSNLMPPDSPGRFSPDAYTDVLAYILRVNGYQPGAPLPSDPDALDNLIMEK